jgi:hypothetical protein
MIVLTIFVAANLGIGQTQPKPKKKVTNPPKQQTSDQEIGKSYSKLQPDQKRSVAGYVIHYNQTTGSNIVRRKPRIISGCLLRRVLPRSDGPQSFVFHPVPQFAEFCLDPPQFFFVLLPLHGVGDGAAADVRLPASHCESFRFQPPPSARYKLTSATLRPRS